MSCNVTREILFECDATVAVFLVNTPREMQLSMIVDLYATLRREELHNIYDHSRETKVSDLRDEMLHTASSYTCRNMYHAYVKSRALNLRKEFFFTYEVFSSINKIH